jgi:hypothetical protein
LPKAVAAYHDLSLNLNPTKRDLYRDQPMNERQFAFLSASQAWHFFGYPQTNRSEKWQNILPNRFCGTSKCNGLPFFSASDFSQFRLINSQLPCMFLHIWPINAKVKRVQRIFDIQCFVEMYGSTLTPVDTSMPEPLIQPSFKKSFSSDMLK